MYRHNTLLRGVSECQIHMHMVPTSMYTCMQPACNSTMYVHGHVGVVKDFEEVSKKRLASLQQPSSAAVVTKQHTK